MTVLLMLVMPFAKASKLKSIQIIDKEIILFTFIDGDILFRDDAKGSSAYETQNDASENSTAQYGGALNIAEAMLTSNWKISSDYDPTYATPHLPTKCYRKSKINGMGQYSWNMATNDYNYETPMQHQIFIVLPAPMKENCGYKISIDSKTGTDRTSANVTFDIFNSRSEAVHVNTVGYSRSETVKSADVYLWMGDGKARDYKSFEGNKVFLYNVDTETATEVGKLEFWKETQRELIHHNFTQSDVWIADFNTNSFPAGNYRLAVEGIGCSGNFQIRDNVYKRPFDVSVKGFYYMRIGEDCMECYPVPRRPLYIQDVNPLNTKIYITTMHPYHPNWSDFPPGDHWDNPDKWEDYVKAGSPTNPNAKGGHSDALDWDRHLGHVSIIYDMLLPFYLTDGKALLDDNCGIRESGNGIPDLLDEARNEVDFWLNLRDGIAYSHGLTNPTNSNKLFQAGTTVVAAWANAVNSATLAYCFQLINNNELEKAYLDSALVAFNFAMSQPDQMLTQTQGMGDITVRGKDLKMSAAAFLYNLTGEQQYEDIFNENCEIKSNNAVVADNYKFQTWGAAAYLSTKRTVNYPELYENIRNSIINEARQKEADYIKTRPSRRGTDNNLGWYTTSQNMHRTIIAHAFTKDTDEKDFFMKALTLEADWGLGRNPLNIIQMTTATTQLEKKRSVVNIYTTGRNDGAPGMHPGHTPYLNAYDWGGNMVMGNPSWMIKKSYPAETNLGSLQIWPMGEIYFDTRYVYAHSEFTPQQTMRGKMALYAYLYANSTGDDYVEDIEEEMTPNNPKPPLYEIEKQSFYSAIQIFPNPASDKIHVIINSDLTQDKAYNIKIYNMAGQLQMKNIRNATPEIIIDISKLSSGAYLLKIEADKYTDSAKFYITK